MLTIRDFKGNNRTVLDKALRVSYDKTSRNLYKCAFTVLNDDPKIKYIQQRGFVEIEDVDGEYIGLFRIEPSSTVVNDSKNETTFTGYHALITLRDDIIDGLLKIEDLVFREAVEKILNCQEVKHWVPGEIKIDKRVTIEFEDVNGLQDPLLSLLNILPVDYTFEYDTLNYPWRINLKKINPEPVCRIKYGYNMLPFQIESDPSELINMVYVKGMDTTGDEPRWVTLEEVNPTGKRYVENKDSRIKYGPVKLIHVENQFTSASNLLDIANRLLKTYGTPTVTASVEALDLAKLVGDQILDIDRLRLNRVVRVESEVFEDLNLYIVGESKEDMFNNPQEIKLVLDTGGRNINLDFGSINTNEKHNQALIKWATDKASKASDVVFGTFELDENGNPILKPEIKQELKGDKGEQGERGADGDSSYTHWAYSNSPDGAVDFTTEKQEGASFTYIGQYSDKNQNGASIPAMYSWTNYKGEAGDQGPKGDPGSAGKDAIVISATPPEDTTRIWRKSPEDSELYIYVSGAWTRVDQEALTAISDKADISLLQSIREEMENQNSESSKLIGENEVIISEILERLNKLKNGEGTGTLDNIQKAMQGLIEREVVWNQDKIDEIIASIKSQYPELFQLTQRVRTDDTGTTFYATDNEGGIMGTATKIKNDGMYIETDGVEVARFTREGTVTKNLQIDGNAYFGNHMVFKSGDEYTIFSHVGDLGQM